MSEKLLGKYIVIEGTDGAGTTTQKDLLKQRLASQGKTVIDIAEPGGTPIGDVLRLIIKDRSLARSPETNLDLFTICRKELARQVIEPTIVSGTHVISDRNWFSTIAYQGFGEGMDVQKIIDRMRTTLGSYFMPNCAVIIDVPVEVSEARISHRGTDANDYFEQMGRPFFERVRQGYLWLASEFSIPVIDGAQTKEQVHQDVIGHLKDL